MNGQAILDIDLAAFEHGAPPARAAAVEGTMRSLRTGFVYVNHDLPDDLLDTAYGLLRAFFAQTAEEKGKHRVDGSMGASGYTGLAVETAASSDTPDWKEMLNWGEPQPPGHPLAERYPFKHWPPRLPGGDRSEGGGPLMELHRRVADLQRRVLRIVAAGVGAHEEHFDLMVADGATMTRAIHYPDMEQTAHAGQVWAAEHSDINLITALPRATAPGLQIRTDSGWIDAEPPDGSAIVNAGIMLDYVTNGVVSATPHRVVAARGQPGDRLSVVQFSHPAPWYVLAPMPSCVTPDNPLRYPPIQAQDMLSKVLWEINMTEGGGRGRRGGSTRR